MGAAAVLALTFVLLSPEEKQPAPPPSPSLSEAGEQRDLSGEGEAGPSLTEAGEERSESPGEGEASPTPGSRLSSRAASSAYRIRVRAGQRVGPVKKIKLRKGERVRVEVHGSGSPDEAHLHGYNLTRRLAPGRPARFSFLARLEGIFELELHSTHLQLAQLRVEP